MPKGFTEAGFVVDWADIGLNGYHLAMTGDYDLIILDIMLPDVNGGDIVRMLRSAKKREAASVAYRAWHQCTSRQGAGGGGR